MSTSKTCVRHLTVEDSTDVANAINRECVSCGVSYDRGAVLSALRVRCHRRWPPLPPIPSSPWSAEERSYDPD